MSMIRYFELVGRALIEKERKDDMNIYKKAVETFGEESRLNLVMEEAAELIQACSKEQRGKVSNINEEIADMEIMLEQLKYLKCYDQEQVDEWHNKKVRDLNKLITDKTGETVYNDKWKMRKITMDADYGVLFHTESGDALGISHHGVCECRKCNVVFPGVWGYCPVCYSKIDGKND